jgi:hypothetical protein
MATVEQDRLVVDAVAAAVRKTPTSRRSKSRAMTRDSGLRVAQRSRRNVMT